jgi:hypothetical protein
MPELLASKVWAMFVDSMPVDVVGGAYLVPSRRRRDGEGNQIFSEAGG